VGRLTASGVKVAYSCTSMLKNGPQGCIRLGVPYPIVLEGPESHFSTVETSFEHFKLNTLFLIGLVLI
jgi:hypothetical protein